MISNHKVLIIWEFIVKRHSSQPLPFVSLDVHFFFFGIYLGCFKYLYLLPLTILERLDFLVSFTLPPLPSHPLSSRWPLSPQSVLLLILCLPTSLTPSSSCLMIPRLSWSLHICFQTGDGLTLSFLVFPLQLDSESPAAVDAVSTDTVLAESCRREWLNFLSSITLFLRT